jgi:hypothetical protein
LEASAAPDGLAATTAKLPSRYIEKSINMLYFGKAGRVMHRRLRSRHKREFFVFVFEEFRSLVDVIVSLLSNILTHQHLKNGRGK